MSGCRLDIGLDVWYSSRKLFFPAPFSQQLSTTNGSSTRGGASCLLPLSILGFGFVCACLGLRHAMMTTVSLYVQTQRINEMKNWFFEKINRANKSLAKLTRERERSHINKIREDKVDITVDTEEIQRILRTCFKTSIAQHWGKKTKINM